MLLFVLFLPLIASGLTLLLPCKTTRQRMLFLVALAHFTSVITFWSKTPATAFNGFLAVDALGLLVLSVVSFLFLMVAFYLLDYFEEVEDMPHRIFVSVLLSFLSFITLVVISRHFGILLIGIEATTLASVPLINFEKTRQSIEASWKFLMICLVGIALALLGTYFLAVSAMNVQTLLLDKLLTQASELSLPWLKISAIFLLIGCGTKMGLAPMHSWLPDAHSQAPSPISALLSGCLLNCAFLSILRVAQICHAAGQDQFFSSMLIVLGLTSMGIAYVFILGQTDYKRMLAYSSVEHMGILAIGIGLGGVGIYGSLLHLVNNAFTKGFVFLVTGNLYKQYHSKKVKDVRGVLRSYPVTGILLLAGFLAVTGAPPFGTFLSELIILYSAITKGNYVVALLFVVFLGLIFLGVADIILRMIQGLPPETMVHSRKETAPMVMPILLLALIVLILGLYIPPFLNDLLKQAAALLGA